VAIQQTAEITFRLVIVGPLTITSGVPAPKWKLGDQVSHQFTATGGEAPLRWSATGLPPGLSITPDGFLSGVLTAPGTFSVAITVADSAA
jgi:hypothetical protein